MDDEESKAVAVDIIDDGEGGNNEKEDSEGGIHVDGNVISQNENARLEEPDWIGDEEECTPSPLPGLVRNIVLSWI